MKNLSELLLEVDILFGRTKPIAPYLATFDYMLGKLPYGWKFSVVNDWHNWLDAGLKHETSVWTTPELAVLEFLSYVNKNDIDVKSLMSE